MSNTLNRIDLRAQSPSGWTLPGLEPDTDLPIAAVRDILAQVADGGDKALLALTERFDGVSLEALMVEPQQLVAAFDRLDSDLRDALSLAADRVRAFHEHQLPTESSFELDGIGIDTIHRPVESAGCYVPGGRAIYPSTVLMSAIPARVAGVDEVCVCVPPGPDGLVPDVTLAAAYLAGVDRLHPIGGAQAIAAMAYGTDSVASVDVIVGPGNKYVATAKRELSSAGIVKVPAAFAGPSEVVVIADGDANPAWAAADVILQAEHGPDGLGWFITWDQGIADSVDASITEQLASAVRSQDIAATLGSSGYLALVDGPEAAIELANRIAPEHLQLMVTDPKPLIAKVRHAGEIFVGPLASAAIGDYAAGPSHVLPTARTARFGQALTVFDFLKEMHVVTVSVEGFDAVASTVIALAEAEQLDAHAEAIRIRQGSGST